VLLISSHQAGTLEASTTARIGAPMVFGRLWEQTGCAAVIKPNFHSLTRKTHLDQCLKFLRHHTFRGL
jgi:hypothetical protein